MLQKFSDVILECYQFADLPTRPTISTGSKVISTWRRSLAPFGPEHCILRLVESCVECRQGEEHERLAA